LPRRTLESALTIARVLRDNYASKTATWAEIAKALNVSKDRAVHRYPAWAAVAYGIVKKEGQDKFGLSEVGRKILAPTYDGEDHEGMVKALLTPSTLSRFYTDYNGSSLPGTDQMFFNVLETRYGVPKARVKEAKETILKNAQFAKILVTAEDGRTTVTISGGLAIQAPAVSSGDSVVGSNDGLGEAKTEKIDYSKICFVITPLGEEGSPERKHADMILRHLIEPVLSANKLNAVRADKISKPGLITQQIVEHIAKARLCIADLSFNNPNAFYELGVRHAFKLSTIQIIRKGDKIPFDVSQGRTITIDTSDPYTIMDRVAAAKGELKEHVGSVMSGKERPEDNPMNLFLPAVKVVIPK
jgi:hypothetical protein